MYCTLVAFWWDFRIRSSSLKSSTVLFCCAKPFMRCCFLQQTWPKCFQRLIYNNFIKMIYVGFLHNQSCYSWEPNIFLSKPWVENCLKYKAVAFFRSPEAFGDMSFFCLCLFVLSHPMFRSACDLIWPLRDYKSSSVRSKKACEGYLRIQISNDLWKIRQVLYKWWARKG